VFDGVNDYASTPLSLGGYTAFTIAAWIKTTVASKDIIATYGVSNIFEFWLTATKYLAFYVYGPGATYRTSSVLVGTGSWVYCVGVYDGSTPTLNTYINGALSNGGLTGTIPASVSAGVSTVVIGNANLGGFYFNGSMGQVSIYNRALTAAEVATNFSLLRGRYGI
jgi:hypothetical protein